MVFGGEIRQVKPDGIRAEINNMSERLQGTFRERARVMRGLQSRESGQKLLDGWVINCNLFRFHEGLAGKTPGGRPRVPAIPRVGRPGPPEPTGLCPQPRARIPQGIQGVGNCHADGVNGIWGLHGLDFGVGTFI